MPGRYVHWARDDGETERSVASIEANPVRAGLAATPRDRFWSSAHDRFPRGGDASGRPGADGPPP